MKFYFLLTLPIYKEWMGYYDFWITNSASAHLKGDVKVNKNV